ncbi:MAG: PQQ-binding-like beta-propeller repeat protein [Bacteroidota bacterium]
MRKILALSFVFLLSYAAFSQVISQWRGPNRDGVYPGTGFLTAWPAAGPPLIWTCNGIGKGYSSAVSDGNMIYVTGMKDSTDYLTALNLKGEIAWQVPFGPSWNSSFPDTRCTPTLENGSIYVLSGLGTISCINAKDGKTNWSYDAAKKFGAVYGDWGVCESLLLADDMVIYTPAGPRTSMVAISKKTGETVWETESLHDTSAYVSPLMITPGDKKIIVTLMANNLIGVDPANGKIRWKYDYAALMPEKSIKVWPGAPKTNTITPLYKDGFLYVTGGYNHVGAMFKLSEDASAITLVWTDTTLDCHHGGVVLCDGYIYGSNWIDNSRGNWCCISWESGKTMYEQKWQTKGSIISCDGMLYLFDEKNGNVGLVKPNPQNFQVTSSFKVSNGKGACWSHPEIKDGILYIRRGDALMAFDVRKK